MLRSECGIDVAAQKVAAIDWDSRSRDSFALSSRIVHCSECLPSDSRDVQKYVVLDAGAESDSRLRCPLLDIRVRG